MQVNFFGDESMDEKAAVFAPLRKLGPVAVRLLTSIASCTLYATELVACCKPRHGGHACV